MLQWSLGRLHHIVDVILSHKFVCFRKLEVAEEELAKAQSARDKAWKVPSAEEAGGKEETPLAEAQRLAGLSKQAAGSQDGMSLAAPRSPTGKLLAIPGTRPTFSTLFIVPFISMQIMWFLGHHVEKGHRVQRRLPTR